jgi:hypothetical protein
MERAVHRAVHGDVYRAVRQAVDWDVHDTVGQGVAVYGAGAVFGAVDEAENEAVRQALHSDPTLIDFLSSGEGAP